MRRLLTVLAPLAISVLRRLGLALQKRNGPTALSNGLLKAGDVGDRARVKLGGKPRRDR